MFGCRDRCEERLRTGNQTLWELAGLFAEIAAIQNLTRRVRTSFTKQKTEIYINEEHRQRMCEAIFGHEGSKPFAAAVFLLSASPGLWELARHVVRDGSVYFGHIGASRLKMDEYTLYQSAKDLYYGGNRMKPEDLCNREIVDDELFRLLISAFIIRRFGVVEMGGTNL